MEHYDINKMVDITYPERSCSTKSNIGIPKNNLRSFYIRDRSEFISSEARDLINTLIPLTLAFSRVRGSISSTIRRSH